jgi:hypothetical protein
MYLIAIALKNEMALYITFEKEADSVIKQLVKTFAGPYLHTDLIISQVNPANINTAYSSFLGEGFRRVFQKDVWFSRNTHDFFIHRRVTRGANKDKRNMRGVRCQQKTLQHQRHGALPSSHANST